MKPGILQLVLETSVRSIPIALFYHVSPESIADLKRLTEVIGPQPTPSMIAVFGKEPCEVGLRISLIIYTNGEPTHYEVLKRFEDREVLQCSQPSSQYVSGCRQSL